MSDWLASTAPSRIGYEVGRLSAYLPYVPCTTVHLLVKIRCWSRAFFAGQISGVIMRRGTG